MVERVDDPSFIIRVATHDDQDAITGIDNLAAKDSERIANIGRWISDGSCHLIACDDTVAAYGVLTDHFFDNGFIEMLMVAERFRRRGFGLALVEHFKTMCIGPKLFSSTNLSNRPMQQLLLKAGFCTSGYIENLDKNDPEIVFFRSVA
ncbi:GNAT family N-acetyltransferase [Devosia rhodophyticola]|uniref:GNAT family N-acetyltransferase n=1 Tax=Devosia rhodophyticola TaxID=3026423 RepID=A0ABY7YZ29_9HYPH|nr:GNAT family N-acetyltransferase [Devosia rhodophyticola]WDR06621.1 GNAT family N-acetyltransferase [Devosia rhodophyticola]